MKHANGYRFTACLLLGIAQISVATGCANQRHQVIAATGTNIGLEISENPATQVPQAKLGYQRVELAIVPTNRSATEKATEGSMRNGAKDVADVLMELRYGDILDKHSSVYQRLAVGKTAVSQGGAAALLFAKDANGTIGPDAQKALKAVKSIRTSDTTARDSMSCLNEHRKNAAKAIQINSALASVSKTKDDPEGLSWDELVDDPDPKSVQALLEELKKDNISCP